MVNDNQEIGMSEALKEKISKIKLLALDFDGTLTDGFVYVNQKGHESVRCSRRDSLGIDMLRVAGVSICVISKETNPIIQVRCKKMRIPCFHSIKTGEGKREILKRVMEKLDLPPHEVAYMGDDVNDIPAMELAGIAFGPSDARPEVKKIAYIVETSGGNHAVREVCELILKAKNITPKI